MSKIISIMGIDGSGKTTAVNNLVNILKTENNLGVIGKVNYSIIKKNKEFYNLNNYYLPKIIEGFNQVFNRLKSFKYLKKNKNLDYIIFERDLIFSSTIYSNYYFPILKKIPLKQKFNLVKTILNLNFSNENIFLDISPKNAMERIKFRESKLNIKIQNHENIKTLSKFRDDYFYLLDYIDSIGIKSKIIDVNNKNKNDLNQELLNYLN